QICDECILSFLFFFQAEDGIRDWSVTGVQTCALPISPAGGRGGGIEHAEPARVGDVVAAERQRISLGCVRELVDRLLGRERERRSEERRVGKEGRTRGARHE